MNATILATTRGVRRSSPTTDRADPYSVFHEQKFIWSGHGQEVISSDCARTPRSTNRINDFDEATIGPWEWDLKRLVANVNVAGRENGLDAVEWQSAVMRCMRFMH